MVRVNNQVLLERLDSLITDSKDNFQKVNEHLEKLNNQVGKNTAFKNTLRGGFKMTSWLLGSGLLIVLVVWLVQR